MPCSGKRARKWLSKPVLRVAGLQDTQRLGVGTRVRTDSTYHPEVSPLLHNSLNAPSASAMSLEVESKLVGQEIQIILKLGKQVLYHKRVGIETIRKHPKLI
jgi:hypothetical protein